MNKTTPEMIKLIKENYLNPKIKDSEVELFLLDAQKKGLDVIQKEIIPIPFKGKISSVVTRDGYVAKAKENPNYLGYRSHAVYEKDKFEYHETRDGFEYSYEQYTGKDYGKVIGAYCIVLMKDPYDDTFVYITFDEARSNTPMWKTKPALMTQKVAEARALKQVINLSGVCSDVEIGQDFNQENVDVDEIPEDMEEISEDTTIKQIESVEEIQEYFESQRRPEGFNRIQIVQEITMLHDEGILSDKCYEHYLEKAQNIPKEKRLFKCGEE